MECEGRGGVEDPGWPLKSFRLVVSMMVALGMSGYGRKDE